MDPSNYISSTQLTSPETCITSFFSLKCFLKLSQSISLKLKALSFVGNPQKMVEPEPDILQLSTGIPNFPAIFFILCKYRLISGNRLTAVDCKSLHPKVKKGFWSERISTFSFSLIFGLIKCCLVNWKFSKINAVETFIFGVSIT